MVYYVAAWWVVRKAAGWVERMVSSMAVKSAD
jgi:hypothetical protein